MRKSADFNYEETVAKVETIIDQIEGGELTLAEVFDRFSVALEDLQQCEAFLARGQQEMNLAIETLEDQF
ncbi:MAG: exodeoxyribonuclease VII small subunit [Cyanobacteriota bacterium]|nr:exodeoxyribonuclease VII small subunit [Cyanobacteriota bacterium]